MAEPKSVLYQLGPMERRGLAGGFRPGQTALVLVSVVVTIVALAALPPLAGLVAAVAAAVATYFVGFVPVSGGRTLEEWVGPWFGHRWAVLTGRTVELGLAAEVGFEREGAMPSQAPADVAGVEILSVLMEGQRVGVLRDAATGSYSIALHTEGPTFMLRDRNEHEALLAGWGEVLTTLCLEGSPISRLQAIEEAKPDPGHNLAAWFEDARDPALPDDSPIVRNMAELIESSAPASQIHEVILVARTEGIARMSVVKEVGARRVLTLVGGAVAALALGSVSPPATLVGLAGVFVLGLVWAGRVTAAVDARDREACGRLAAELPNLVNALSACDVREVRPLGPREVAMNVRALYDPAVEARRAPGGEGDQGVSPANPWPVSMRSDWSWVQSDSGLSRVFRVREFPRSPVHPDWQAPLLLGGSNVRRRVSYVFEGVPNRIALQRAQFAVTQDESAEAAGAQKGFRMTSAKRKQHEAARAREEELASGHGFQRYATYISVTVDAGDLDGLEAASKALTLAAARAGCDISPEYGRQATALTYLLPLGRGL